MDEQEGGAKKRLGRDGQKSKEETVQGKRARERQWAEIKKLSNFKNDRPYLAVSNKYKQTNNAKINNANYCIFLHF